MDRERVEKRRRGAGAGRRRRIISPELRLRAVKLYVEEGLPSNLICQELGVNRGLLYKWVARYRHRGEDGLKRRHPVRSKPAPASEHQRRKIAEVKRQQPVFGVNQSFQVRVLDGQALAPAG